MSGDLLVLLLALVVEDQNFLAAALIEDFAGHQRSRLWTRNLPLAGRHCQHVRELDLAVRPSCLGLQADYISGRHSVLLSTSADDRVHTPASVVVSRPAHLSAAICGAGAVGPPSRGLSI